MCTVYWCGGWGFIFLVTLTNELQTNLFRICVVVVQSITLSSN